MENIKSVSIDLSTLDGMMKSPILTSILTDLKKYSENGIAVNVTFNGEVVGNLNSVLEKLQDLDS